MLCVLVLNLTMHECGTAEGRQLVRHDGAASLQRLREPRSVQEAPRLRAQIIGLKQHTLCFGG